MKILICVASFVLVTAFIPNPRSIKLEYAFKVGDGYTMTHNTRQTIKQSIMGTDQTGNNDYSSTMKLKVVSLTPSGGRLEVQIVKMKNSMKNMMGETVMDSDGPADNAQNKILKSMMEKPFFINMTKDGIVEKVEQAENIWSGVDKLEIDESTRSTLKTTIGQFVNEGSLKTIFEQGLIRFPDKKVKYGDTWNSKTGLAMDFPIQCDNSWMLESVESGKAVVNGAGVYTTTDKDKVIALPIGLNAKVNLNGNQKVKTQLSVKTGWPGNVDIRSELKGTMFLLAGGMLPQDMEVPMEVISETTYKLDKE